MDFLFIQSIKWKRDCCLFVFLCLSFQVFCDLLMQNIKLVRK